MKLRFHARIAFLFAASLGAALLPACGTAQCAAQCAPILTLTVTNADAAAHSYVITVTAPELGTLTETCGSTADAGAGAPTCTGGFFQSNTENGQIKLQIDVNPVPFDVTVTKDGTQVASAHLTPTSGTNEFCGTVCPTGDATLALP